MAKISIRSFDDPRLDPYRQLKHREPGEHHDLFVTEGRWLVQRLVRSGYPVHSVLVDEANLGSILTFLPPDVDVFCVPNAWVSRIVGFNFHRGVLACGQRLRALPLRAALARHGCPHTVVVAAGIADPTNLGGVLRNAAAFGVPLVLLGTGCADPLARRVIRVSMGNVLYLTTVVSADLSADLRVLDEFAYERMATVLDSDAEPLPDARRSDRLAIVFGGEGYGIRADLLGLCGRKVTLPMQLGTDSLNVASASAIFLYDLVQLKRPGRLP